jgi:hypothetical protein
MDCIRAKDVAALRGVLAEGFVYRTPQGEDVGAEGFLDGVAGLPVSVVSLHGERVQALVFGETAVLTGIQVAVTQDGEAPEAGSRGAFVDVFVRRAGEWKLALAYGVDLPEGSSQPA